jgi:BlaI family transcriptional regulator, penicillinase repressor
VSHFSRSGVEATASAMEQQLQDVTDAELAVLQVLWDEGPATIRLLTDTLYPPGTDAHYATVQKLLERLEAKGHVRRDRSNHAHVFDAATDRDALVGRRLRVMAEKLCGGMMGSLLTHLVRAEQLNAHERQELRALMDELDRKQRPRSETKATANGR